MEYFYVFLKNVEYLRKGNFCIVNQQNELKLFQVLPILPPRGFGITPLSIIWRLK